ncbi:hypothetical protein JCM19300_2971 [Algibacter lectus]|uniref:Uncharacterized protein n=1 Tax=Algibacter lectus TaxID=221126 RepID=A0A090VBM7_9FLAO|nr:hypothetical protein JCM19300_2971 [Algibacter lectus]GAL81126.1 hypothetical protein JCM19274_3870 [Algibacter lectus]
MADLFVIRKLHKPAIIKLPPATSMAFMLDRQLNSTHN